MSASHEAAIEQAYLLIEAAQGHNDAARVEDADREAVAHGWADVRLLLHFVRALACAEDGEDDSAHVSAMFDMAVGYGDPALLALAVGVKATRLARRRRTTTVGESAASLLVQAVVLLDEDEGGPVVHRAGALIEVACVAHELGLWEMALEYYELTEQAIAGELGWAGTVPRHRRVIAINNSDLALDWSSALAAIGDWEAAAERARTALASGDPTDAGWPPSWITQFHVNLRLLTALAGDLVTPAGAGIAVLSEAIVAARAGDAARAATLAEAAPENAGVPLPTFVHLLRLSLIAKRPGTTPAAIRYGDELAALRWHDRLDRTAAMRDAIAVERGRRDHDRLRREIGIDELTGLANRRGYQAYLTALGDGASQGWQDDPGYDDTGYDDTGYTVMMIDVDRFKAVNDGFGHDVGDLVLARLGHILASYVRPLDLAARLGGDEFVLILADVQPGVADARAAHIVEAVRSHPWNEIAEGLAVSISIGVHNGGRHEVPTMLSGADRCLYNAKHQGRGRVASAGP